MKFLVTYVKQINLLVVHLTKGWPGLQDHIIAPRARVKVLVPFLHPFSVRYLIEMAEPLHRGHVLKNVVKNFIMALTLKKNLSNWLRNGTAFHL